MSNTIDIASLLEKKRINEGKTKAAFAHKMGVGVKYLSGVTNRNIPPGAKLIGRAMIVYPEEFPLSKLGCFFVPRDMGEGHRGKEPNDNAN